jgi:hypothetical protein
MHSKVEGPEIILALFSLTPLILEIGFYARPELLCISDTWRLRPRLLRFMDPGPIDHGLS